MHLLQSDVLRLLSQIPYLTIGKQASAKTFVAAMVRDGEELNAILMQFPEVQYEPLDQHYELLKCMGALSEELVSDLCTDYTWRGVVWAAWLVALAPASQYRPHLASAHADVSRHNQWLVELALAEIDSTTWQPDIELQALVQRLRTLLSRISPPKIALRRVPNAQQLALAEVEYLMGNMIIHMTPSRIEYELKGISYTVRGEALNPDFGLDYVIYADDIHRTDPARKVEPVDATTKALLLNGIQADLTKRGTRFEIERAAPLHPS